MMDIIYKGEFGYEIFYCVVYAYYLHNRGELKSTTSYKDTKCLYFFSKNHKEIEGNRISSMHMQPKLFPDDFDFKNLTNEKYTIDLIPFKEKYRNNLFVFDKPLLVIYNSRRRTLENDKNYLDIDVLKKLFNMCLPKYKIVYIFPKDRHIVADECPSIYVGDYGLIYDEYRDDVIDINKLYEEYKEKGFKITFNELQLMICANCDKFISICGGGYVISSLFGGINIGYLYKSAHAWEDWSKSISRISNCSIINTHTYEELIQTVKKFYIDV